MKVLETIIPVFFMLLLGFLSRRYHWISPDQKEGVKKVLFSIVLPIVVFNAIFTSDIQPSLFLVILYALLAWCAAFVIGKLCSKWISERYSKIVPYMLWTVEGGSVALPLYTSIVGEGYAINTITFDMAGIIIGFVLIPILVSKESAKNASSSEIIKKILTNSFVLALVFGLILNFMGVYSLLDKINVLTIYTDTVSMATVSLTGLILFSMGYELSLKFSMLMPILRLSLIRIVTSVMIVLGIFFLFPHLMENRYFMIAVLVYFSCPTGFANQLQVQPLFKDETDESFLSTYLSLYMIVTLIAYVLIVSFVV
ncbi:AEC family transporter [uncultured Traorella sp.]|uniref:AEC family transporter n=3 Tax=Traorella TaxID=1929045 RepID=UPI0025ECB881|nr:AEC family transporter [uncultured Traorella sp.]